MAENRTTRKRIAVLGGGMAGLAAALRLYRHDPSLAITLFEATDRLGGSLHTERAEGFVIERGADMFLSEPASPWARQLAEEVGLGGELIGTRPQDRGAYVVCRGKLLPVPPGFQLAGTAKIWPVLRSPVLSLAAKRRLAWERFVPKLPANAPEESLAEFATRRLGRETYERLVEPLAAGIFTADGRELSAAAALPQFVEMECRHGSLTRGMAQRARQAASDGSAAGARYDKFLAPREGMSRLPEAVAAQLPEGMVRKNSPVERVEKCEAGWRLVFREEQTEPEVVDGVVVALPAFHAASVLRRVDVALADELAEIVYASSAVVALGYRREQLPGMPPCFGFVVPAIEARPIVAGSFASNKFEGRAPAGHALVRVFLGGALRGELVELPDDELLRIARQELGDLIGAEGEPVIVRIARWRRAMPQYTIGHLERLRRIDARLADLPTIALAGAAYRGVGIPQCIHSGQQAAERVLAALGMKREEKREPQMNTDEHRSKRG